MLGWEEWRRIDSQYAYGMVRTALEANIEAGNLPRQPIEPLAHLIIGALNEAGLAVAASRTPAATRDQFLATPRRRARRAPRVGPCLARRGLGRALRGEVLAVDVGEEALDAVDDERRPQRREDLERVLRARHLGVHDRDAGLGQRLDEAARLGDGHERVAVAVDDEEGRGARA